MDFRIYRNPEELESTGFIEIGPGKYSGNHWQADYLFIWEDAFVVAECIVAKHFTSYDHLGMNDIPRATGRSIISEWRSVASALPGLAVNEAISSLRLDDLSLTQYDKNEIASNIQSISGMLSELADACEQFYESNEWICILGV